MHTTFTADRPPPSPAALFCFEPPAGPVGTHVSSLAAALASRGREVHLFTRELFFGAPAPVRNHVLGTTGGGDLLAEGDAFRTRAIDCYLTAFAGHLGDSILAFDWSAAGVLAPLRHQHHVPGILSLHSLQHDRTDLTEPLRQAIESAQQILVADRTIADTLRQRIPSCAGRIVQAREVFPLHRFERDSDPAAVRARFSIDPGDSLLLFVGDLEERWGPDLLLRAMPGILRHHPRARLVIVGEGGLSGPLGAYRRYLHLEDAVRLVGHLADDALDELVGAAEVVVVPSREPTPWCPVQAAWAARKAVVATHDAARGLTEHEKDAIGVYPSENSLAGGIERVLGDDRLRKCLGEAGRHKLEGRCGIAALAEQVDRLLTPFEAG